MCKETEGIEDVKLFMSAARACKRGERLGGHRRTLPVSSDVALCCAFILLNYLSTMVIRERLCPLWSCKTRSNQTAKTFVMPRGKRFKRFKHAPPALPPNSPIMILSALLDARHRSVNPMAAFITCYLTLVSVRIHNQGKGLSPGEVASWPSDD